ncbi:hypothetical protein C8R47DRAFT_1115808 [Mycena vitilis]|nr:hypothetical protein C8R47DRAFT_1115808 [Mycena vitilis]
MSRSVAPKGCDSSSVTMEKGRYRMRAPSTPIRPMDSAFPSKHPVPKQSGRRNNSGISSLMAALVILLALACLASFGFAYYLLTTRWDATMPTIHNLADENTKKVVPFDRPLREYHPSEKFLSYLPHSGLHNQRIALENAIVLGALTNRTVLVPPIRLGKKPLRYVNSESLRGALAISGKTGLRHCAQIRVQFLPPECFDYFDYTHISPAWLFNLTAAAGFPPLEYLDDLAGRSVLSRLDLPALDILTLPDSTPYHYRFVDTLSNSTHKYAESIYIPDLARHPHRLLAIGSLFSSSRLRLRDRGNKKIRTQVRRCMDFSSPQLVETADAIGKAIGVHYLGAHVRLGDGSFKANGDAILRQVWWKLVHDILQFNISETSHLERTFSLSIEPSPSSNDSRPRSLLFDFSPGNMRCRGHRHPSAHMARLNSPLFISTDVKDAATHPSFSGFLRTFPCAFFLSDFAVHTRRLNSLINGYDGTVMTPFLLPLLDAMVVGRAWMVAGTDGSTFSRFIEDVLWTKHHGMDIIERG